MIPIISFVGRHNAGKTTLLTRLVSALSQRGLKIAYVKHAHHDLTINPAQNAEPVLTAGEDSELVFAAGASFVVASSPHLSVQYRRYEAEPNITSVLASVPAGMDLIIVEGYKHEALAKVEVLRREVDPTPMLLPGTAALVSDFPLKAELPVFQAGDIDSLADFILKPSSQDS